MTRTASAKPKPDAETPASAVENTQSSDETEPLAPWENMPEVAEFVAAPVVIPDKIKELVDKYYNAHKRENGEDTWFQLPFPDEQSAADVHKLAKKYAESQDPQKTVRRKTHADKSVLVFRVIDKVTRKPSETPAEGVTETAPTSAGGSHEEKDGK